ncbi:MAG TPA: sodium:solute symporter, partial [Thermoanaerobaculia bacterium]|nr:sodium:solute symporter [Thermoanaerobaculia bacterium]
PMQFFILFVGAMVFVFYQFVAPPPSFNPTQQVKPEQQALHAQTFEAKRSAALRLVDAMHRNDSRAAENATLQLRVQQQREAELRRDNSDTDYVFLTFVMQNLPPGLVGLLLAAVFCAAMSATASGLNSLASTSVVDVWRRLVRRDCTDHQYVTASRWMTVGWGTFCIVFALFANRMGALIVAVNKVGSFFYGTMLAVFLLAFYFKFVRGWPTFFGAIVALIAVALCAMFTTMAWLWWNVVGCGVGVAAALLIEAATRMTTSRRSAA